MPFRFVIVILLVASVGATRPRAIAAQQSTVDTLARSFIRRHQIPGASIAVIKDGELVVNGGFGLASLELAAPALPVSVYEIGSISKQFTAVAILRLVEDGKLALDDAVTRHLPGLPAAWSAVTIRHLVTHTGGVPDWEARTPFSYHREYTPAEFVQLVSPLPLDFAPGSRFAYTNTGAPLLGLVIEHVTGVPFERFVTEQVLPRAGLTHTRYRHQEDVVTGRASGYVDSAGTLRNGEPHRPRIIAPSGGLISTAADMVRWMDALGMARVLRAETVALMTAPVRLNDGAPFSAGMGWFLDAFRGHAHLLHNGSTVGGFSSVIYWYPRERLGVAVLMNVDRFNAVNTLATMVAGVVVPGLSIASLPERPDPDPALSGRLLGMLNAVAAGRDTDLLADNLRNPGAASRARRDFGFAGTPDRFAFLEREDMSAGGVIRFGNAIRWIHRYRLTSGGRIVNYTFELSPAGRVARFLAEAQ